MKTTLCITILGAVILANHASMADDPAATGGGIDLQGEAFINLRDPFWPVGYKPASESEKIEDSKIADLKAKIKWPALPLRGITHAGGKRYIAIIEGVGIVESGDIVTIKQDSLIYRWVIDRVTGDGISSTRLDVTEKVGN